MNACGDSRLRGLRSRKPIGFRQWVVHRLNRFLDGIDEVIDCVYETPTAEHDKIIYNTAYCFALEKCAAAIKRIIDGKEFNDSNE